LSGFLCRLLKDPGILQERTSAAKQAAEKGWISSEIERGHTPGAKAHADSIGFIAKAKALAYLEATAKTAAEAFRSL
jgi:hypothetical protein